MIVRKMSMKMAENHLFKCHVRSNIAGGTRSARLQVAPAGFRRSHSFSIGRFGVLTSDNCRTGRAFGPAEHREAKRLFKVCNQKLKEKE